MKKKTFDYQAPECEVFGILVENVLCSSPSEDEGRSTIEDYEKEIIGW